MTPSFRGASVRLIPKKGDFSNIKNWRPISLLSNVYKIFSRVLNNRIAKYTNRICSRAQKGFNTCRYTQEAIINVWESIAHCRKNNIHAAILAADMEKAFDSISLGYLDQVYKFFGIGPYMRSLLKLAGNEREACIILDNRILSRNFKLERGRPQGDIISPLTFNFCIQILIFKLELDPRIERIPRPVFADQILDPNDRIQSFFRYESARETDNIEALADDNTAITLLNASSLGTVKQILDDFSRISGLKCNTSKTVVMPTFDYTANDRKIVTDLGFAIADKITLLGVEISNKLDNISEIFTKIREKIVKLINFWDRFKLSLPGRITILKTCLISQLNYIGCFLPVPHDVLDSIQMLLDNFVKKNLRVAKERLYLSAEKGGLGCIDLKTFLAGQTCAWFVRCFKFKIDNWRHDLVMAAPEKNLTLLRSLDLDPVSSPILHNIASSFEKFYSDFSRVNGNFKAAYVFSNEAFKRSAADTGLLDIQFFGQEFYNANKHRIRSLKFCDFFSEGRMKTRQQLEIDGLPVSPALWLRLQSAGSLAWNTLRKRDATDNIFVEIYTFLNNWKKGSKLIKKTMLNTLQADADPLNLQITVSFQNLSETGPPPLETLENCLGAWYRSSLQNNMREFLFKFRNNQLPLNNRVNAYDDNADPRCSFCRIVDNQSTTRESFKHLFYECPVTSNLLGHFVQKFVPVPRMDTVNFKNMYWYGTFPENQHAEKPILFIMDCFRFTLWSFKTRRRIPNYLLFDREMDFLIMTTLDRTKEFKYKVANINMLANFVQARG